MKYAWLFLLVCPVVSAQTKLLDKLTNSIMESDLVAFNSFVAKNTLSPQELIALKSLNETMLEKRKYDSWKNHWRPTLDGKKILLFFGFLFGQNGGNLLSNATGARNVLDPLKNNKEKILLAISLCSLCASYYCLVKLVKSLLQQADDYERLYLNAIAIKALLEQLINSPAASL